MWEVAVGDRTRHALEEPRADTHRMMCVGKRLWNRAVNIPQPPNEEKLPRALRHWSGTDEYAARAQDRLGMGVGQRQRLLAQRQVPMHLEKEI